MSHNNLHGNKADIFLLSGEDNITRVIFIYGHDMASFYKLYYDKRMCNYSMYACFVSLVRACVELYKSKILV